MANHPREEITFLLIKPDGVWRGLIGEIIRRLEQCGLKIVALEMFQPTEEQIDGHYPKDEAWLRRVGDKTLRTYEQYAEDPQGDFGTTDNLRIGQEVRRWLVRSMSASPLVRIVAQGIHAVDAVRKIVGATIPALADMGTIRGDFSIDSTLLSAKERRPLANLVHASETPEEAKHEIAHWFGDNPKLYSYEPRGVDE